MQINMNKSRLENIFSNINNKDEKQNIYPRQKLTPLIPNAKQYLVIWDDSNNRWLGSKTSADMDDMTHVWNPSTSSWDTI